MKNKFLLLDSNKFIILLFATYYARRGAWFSCENVSIRTLQIREHSSESFTFLNAFLNAFYTFKCNFDSQLAPIYIKT